MTLWLHKEPIDRKRRLAQASSLLLLGLLGEKHSLDVRQNSTLGDGHTREELVQFLVVTDSQLQVTGDDTSFLIVTGGITGQLEHLGCEVFHDGSQVDWGTGTNALSVVALT